MRNTLFRFTRTIQHTSSGEAIFLFLFLAVLPLQTRITLFSPHPFDEWHAGFLYASDLAIWGFVLLGIVSFLVRRAEFTWRENLSRFDKKVLGTLAFFFLWAAASAAHNGFQNFSAYHLIKVGEGIILFSYFFFRFPQSFSWRLVRSSLLFGAFVQSVIAIAQFVAQRSLGLWFFRESILTVGDPQVAQIMVQGVRMIRAYGTFPNPNVLAAFLAVSLFFLYVFFMQRTKSWWLMPVMGAVQFVLLLALFLTFSRAILILFFIFSIGAFIAFACKIQERKRFFYFVLIWVTEIGVLAAMLFPELTRRFVGVGIAQDASISERLFFNIVAFDAIRLHAAWGVGIGNFVFYFKNSFPGLSIGLYQPVHNIFLLIAAELGLPAFLAFLGFVSVIAVQAARTIAGGRIRGEYLFLCACLLFMLVVGMEDHFFWTIQQTTLLFWAVLGMVGGYGRGQNQNSNVKIQN